MQALYMQMRDPDLSGLTSVPMTTEGAREEKVIHREMQTKKEACSLLYQWTPMGKSLM